MDRKDFLFTLGKGTLAVCAACYLASCNSPTSPNVPSAPSNIDITLDLTQSANSALNNVGGYIYSNNLIIARISQTQFVALSSICTHQGGTVFYDSSGKEFHCPVHGSNFSTSGAVINGPAGSPLKKYNTSLTGTSLRVFS